MATSSGVELDSLMKQIVWQIAQRDYSLGKGKHRSLTKATYDAVGDYFRQLWGKEAGWAHSVLFTADLRAFSARLTTKAEVLEVKRETDIDQPIAEAYIKPDVVIVSSLKREVIDEDFTKTTVEETLGAVKKRRRRR